MEFRESIQGTVSKYSFFLTLVAGLNCAVGFVGGIAQVGQMTSQFGQMLISAIKYVIKLVFNRRNITTPLNVLRKQIIPSKRTRDYERIWADS